MSSKPMSRSLICLTISGSTVFRKAARRVSLSIKSLEMAEEKEAIEQFGSSDSGASLGDILGAALKNANRE